jgi:hypothetical protein
LQSLLKIARLGSRLERQEVVEDKAGVGRAFAIIAARAALAGRCYRAGSVFNYTMRYSTIRQTVEGAAI